MPNPCGLAPQSALNPLHPPRSEGQPCKRQDCETGDPKDCACVDGEHCIEGACVCATDADCKPVGQGRCIAGACYVKKNRYISFIPQNMGVMTALRVTVVSSPVSFGAGPYWVGPPTLAIDGLSPDFMFSRLQCTPDYRDWGAIGLIHVADDEIVPSELLGASLSEAVYDIQAIAENALTTVEANYSCALRLPTAKWGDVIAQCVSAKSFCHPPDGIVNMMDINAIVDKFQGEPGGPRKPMSDIAQQCPMPMNPINFQDVNACGAAFQSKRFPYVGLLLTAPPWTPVPICCGSCGSPASCGGAN